MRNIAAPLHEAIAAVFPDIDGVSIGRADDKSTWKVHFKGDVTDEARAAAQPQIDAVIANFELEPAKGAS